MSWPGYGTKGKPHDRARDRRIGDRGDTQGEAMTETTKRLTEVNYAERGIQWAEEAGRERVRLVAAQYVDALLYALENADAVGFISRLDAARVEDEGGVTESDETLMARAKAIRRQLHPDNEWDQE